MAYIKKIITAEAENELLAKYGATNPSVSEGVHDLEYIERRNSNTDEFELYCECFNAHGELLIVWDATAKIWDVI